MTEKHEDVRPVADAKNTFLTLGLPEDITSGLTKRGILEPTPIQAKVIPLLLAADSELSDGDLLAQARTGSGKTLAYLLPLVAAFRAGAATRAWVVCPTRELAAQVSREAALVLNEDSIATLVGGASFPMQLRELSRKPCLIVATPGRMGDHIRQGTLEEGADVLVLDEADQILNLGFREELDGIVNASGSGSARWFFSATFPRDVQEAAGDWLRKPRQVRLDQGKGSSHVPQFYVCTPWGNALETLARLIRHHEPRRALIFVRTRVEVEEIVQSLQREGLGADGLSGDLSQEARDRALLRFREGRIAHLVATDVAARGLDIAGVTHVYNYGTPNDPANFVHRIGRTARAGAEGEAWSVIAPGERRKFLMLSRSTDSKPEEKPVPSRRELVDSSRTKLALRVGESLGEGLLLPEGFRPLVEEHGAEAVLAALVHKLVPEPPPEAPRRDPKVAKEHLREGGEWIAMGVGRNDGVEIRDIMQALARSAGTSADDIGEIKLLPGLTLLEVSPQAAGRILSAKLSWRGRRLKIRQAEPPRSR